ncbi:hypothetical protein S245_030811, partial [Arachis hypogaea]
IPSLPACVFLATNENSSNSRNNDSNHCIEEGEESNKTAVFSGRLHRCYGEESAHVRRTLLQLGSSVRAPWLRSWSAVSRPVTRLQRRPDVQQREAAIFDANDEEYCVQR